MRKRVAVTYAAGRGYFVDLPTYQVIENTFAPVTPGLLTAAAPIAGAKVADVLALAPTVEVELPDEWFNAKGAMLRPAEMRAMYADHPRYSLDTYSPPTVSSP